MESHNKLAAEYNLASGFMSAKSGEGLTSFLLHVASDLLNVTLVYEDGEAKETSSDEKEVIKKVQLMTPEIADEPVEIFAGENKKDACIIC
jgi:hypothetical protein